jgi:integrase
MAGQLYKRGGNVWQVRIYLGKDADGKQKFHRKTIHGTKKDAQKYLTAKLREKDLGVFVETTTLFLNEYLDRWLADVAKARVTEKTYQGYVWQLKQVRDKLGSRKLSTVRGVDVQKFYGELQAAGMSPKTVRHIHAVLSSAFKQAVKWQMLAANPCDAAELPRQVRHEMQSLNKDEAARFLAAAQEDKHAVIFSFMLCTGARPAETFGLKWSDLDVSKGRATITRTLHWRAGGGWYFGEPKTSRSRRTVPLPASLTHSLKAHRRQQAETRLRLGPDYQNHDLVFATEIGTPLHWQNVIKRHFKKILHTAGLPESFRLYDLRHTCATLLLQAGVNPKVVSERLGHASIVLTLDTYSHVLPDMQNEATAKLEKILFG